MSDGSTSLRIDEPTEDVQSHRVEYGDPDIFDPWREDGDSDDIDSALSWPSTAIEPSEPAPGLLSTTSPSAAIVEQMMHTCDPLPDPSVTEPRPLSQRKRVCPQPDDTSEKRTRISNTTPSSDRDCAGDRCSIETPIFTTAVTPPLRASPGDDVDTDDVSGPSIVACVRAILYLFNPDPSTCLVVDTANSDSQRDGPGDLLEGLTARYDTVVLISTGNPWTIVVARTALRQATLYDPRHDSQDRLQSVGESYKRRLGDILSGMDGAMKGDWDIQTHRQCNAPPSEHARLVETLASAIHGIHGLPRRQDMPIQPWRTAVALAAGLTDDAPIDALPVDADTDAGPSQPLEVFDGGREGGDANTHTRRIPSLAQQIRHALRICETCETMVKFLSNAVTNETRYLREMESRHLELISRAVDRLKDEHGSSANVHDAEIKVRGISALSVHIERSRYTNVRTALIKRIGAVRQSATVELKCLGKKHAGLLAETQGVLNQLNVMGKDISKALELQSSQVLPTE